MKTKPTVAIVGSGISAALIARLLHSTARRIVLYGDQTQRQHATTLDDRVYALNYFSCALLSRISGGDVAGRKGWSPYQAIETWVSGSRASLSFNADAIGVDALGALVSHGELLRTLSEGGSVPLEHESLAGDSATDLARRYDLVIWANAKPCPDFIYRQTPYHQSVLSATVALSTGSPGTLYQALDHNQSIGLLGYHPNRAMVVWSSPSPPEQQLLPLLQKAFGRVASIDAVLASRRHPALAFRVSDSVVAGRVVLLGDSADLLHPLAGQGLNQAIASAYLLFEAMHTSGGIVDNASLALFSHHYFSHVRPKSYFVHGFQKLLQQNRRFLQAAMAAARVFPGLEVKSMELALGLALAKRLDQTMPV